MNRRRLFVVLVAIALAIPLAGGGGGDVDADRIAERASRAAYYAGDDGRAQARMLIVDGQGRRRHRQFTMLRRDRRDGGAQDYLVVFSRPADVRDTVFLVSKHRNDDDDRWLYLPALDLVKRIAAGDKRTSFVGSHFFYEDVSGRSPDADRHELVETTGDHYVLLNTPKDAGEVEFASYKAWIDKDTFLPVKLEYRDSAGRTYRRVETQKVETIEGYPTATRMKVTDVQSGGYTIAEMRGVQYDIGLPDSVFAERSLRTPPRRWLRER